MTAVSADGIFNCIFLNKNDRIPIQISLTYFTRGPIDNKPALIQVIVRIQAITWTNEYPVYWHT